MSAIFFWKKEPLKKTQIFHIFKAPFLRNGWLIDMNVGVFRETSVDFLKGVALQLFPKYCQSNVNLNVKSRTKFNCL